MGLVSLASHQRLAPVENVVLWEAKMMAKEIWHCAQNSINPRTQHLFFSGGVKVAFFFATHKQFGCGKISKISSFFALLQDGIDRYKRPLSWKLR